MLGRDQTQMSRGFRVPHGDTGPLNSAVGFDDPHRLVTVRRGDHVGLGDDPTIDPERGDIETFQLV